MREILCHELLQYAKNPEFIFLTGDLGYKVLETLREAMDNRFINAGVAEQNMVSMAAGMAAEGAFPWIFSIAPFLYARSFEQIRNDIALHKFPVVLIGNGGGFAYGVMGPTHHALQDYGVLQTLPNLTLYLPAFAADIGVIVKKLFTSRHPAYLRLGGNENPAEFASPPFAPWRKLSSGDGPTIVVTGPFVGNLLNKVSPLPSLRRPTVWLVSVLPLTDSTLPQTLIEDIRSRDLIVCEEHVCHGGIGQALIHCLATRGIFPRRFQHHYASGYLSGRYGSQSFHRKECGLTAEEILNGV